MEKDLTAASAVATFVNSSINQIKEGLPEGFRIKDDIEFELAVVSLGDRGGSVDLRVLNFGGNKSKEETQKIRFSVTDKEPDIDPIKEAQKNALKKRGLI